MVENRDIALDIQSEIFALANSIIKLNDQYNKGTINHDFYLKAIKNARNNLIKINFHLKENNIILTDLLKRMNFSEQYYKTIDIINQKHSALSSEHQEDLDRKFHFSGERTRKSPLLELPAITSEITSSFITLMDALKLEGIKGSAFISQLFNDLISHLEKFPGLEVILSIVKSIQHKFLNNPNKKNETFRDQIVDDLYAAFKEFQTKLDIKT